MFAKYIFDVHDPFILKSSRMQSTAHMRGGEMLRVHADLAEDLSPIAPPMSDAKNTCMRVHALSTDIHIVRNKVQISKKISQQESLPCRPDDLSSVSRIHKVGNRW